MAETVSASDDSNDNGSEPYFSTLASSRAVASVNWPVIWVRPPGMGSRTSGALTTFESSTNAVWVPTLAAVKSAQILVASPLNCTIDDVLAALLIEARGGVLDLLTADDRLVEQIYLLAVGRAGDQRQVRIVVAGQDVVLAAAGRLKLQRQDLDLLVGALAQLLLVGDALRERGLTGRRRRRGRAPGVPGAGAGAPGVGAPGVGGGCGAGGWAGRLLRIWAGLRRRRPRRRRGWLLGQVRRGCSPGAGAPGCAGAMALGGTARRRRAAHPAARPAGPSVGGCWPCWDGITWITGRMYSRAV